MPNGVYPVPKHSQSAESGRANAGLAVRVRTRFRRGRLDRQLAQGVDPASSPELELRTTQLRSPAERARVANALVEAVGDARRGEPMTLGSRPQRAAVRDAADDILALALHLREDRSVSPEGLARAASLVDDRKGLMYRVEAGDLQAGIRSALSALDPTRERSGDRQAQAA